jgi:hypothetical protein
MRLKANQTSDFNQVIERDILPMLRKQKGHRDCIIVVTPNGREALGISFWDTRADAEAWDRTATTELPKLLGKVLEGRPEAKSYEVTSSTVQHLGMRAA